MGTSIAVRIIAVCSLVLLALWLVPFGCHELLVPGVFGLLLALCALVVFRARLLVRVGSALLVFALGIALAPQGMCRAEFQAKLHMGSGAIDPVQVAAHVDG
jgi:hypothetical protein